MLKEMSQQGWICTNKSCWISQKFYKPIKYSRNKNQTRSRKTKGI